MSRRCRDAIHTSEPGFDVTCTRKPRHRRRHKGRVRGGDEYGPFKATIRWERTR